jgi:hypothetical protein
MPPTIFSCDTRVLICNQCGAPLEATVEGGAFQCRYCGAQNQVIARDDRSLLAPQQAPIGEDERMVRLRAQDGAPAKPPASLEGLLQAGQLPPWKEQEAVTLWQATRAELRTRADYEASERLLFLTMLLTNHGAEQHDLMRQRAMLESTLDVFTMPRHRQIMRGYLSRCAAHQGDLDAAERWLAPCDPRSDNLDMDSAYRFSRALIDTARGSFQAVVHTLGAGAEDVPILDAFEGPCAVLRANGWEKVGQVPVAVQLLLHYFQKGGPQGRAAARQMIASHPTWALCSQSYPAATADHDLVAAEATGRMVGSSLRVFLPVGIGLSILGLVSVAGVVIAGLLGQTPGIGIGVGAVIASLAIFLGLIFSAIGYTAYKAAKRVTRIRARGLRATGEVRSVQDTNVKIDKIPQIAVTLLVKLEGRSPYEATATMPKFMGKWYAPRDLVVGTSVPLRVDPDDPREVMIEVV